MAEACFRVTPNPNQPQNPKTKPQTPKPQNPKTPKPQPKSEERSQVAGTSGRGGVADGARAGEGVGEGGGDRGRVLLWGLGIPV